MAEHLTERDPIDLIADDFLERQRRGEMPSIDEYARKHPALADEIRELFPTIAELEGLKRRQANAPTVRPNERELPIEQLADFRIVREIGRGGMGIVYEAEQESLGRRVAIKVLPKQSLLKPKQLARFKREAQTAARLHHTHIVPVFGVGEEDGYHFIVMQLIPGAGLDEVLAELRRIDAAGVNGLRARSNGRPTHRPASSVARSLLAMQSTDGAANAHTLAASGSFTFEDASAASEVREPTVVVDGEVPLESESSGEMGRSSHGGRALGRDYWKNIARIGRDAADALEYAHRLGTLHRDVKPGNLLVDNDGAVWVADFGLAKPADGEAVSQTDDVVGTLRYMAPEQIRGNADARSDVYSLGLTLYELVTLQPAYDQEACHQAVAHGGRFSEPARPGKLVKHLPRDLETIIVKAIVPEPERRYQTAGELAADLNRYLADRPIRARRMPWHEQLLRWSKRNRGVAALSALAILLLIAVAAVSSVGYVRTEQAREIAEDRLEQERIQRKRAEGTLMTSLEALDAVYRQFAPETFRETQTLTLENDEDNEQVTIRPALSPEHAKFLEEILVYYDKLASHSGGNLQLRKESARANRRVGDIQQRLGNFPRARKAYDRAADKYRALMRVVTSDAETREIELELARIDNRQGEVHRGKQEFRESNAAFNSARKRLEAIAKSSNDANARFELARTHYLLASNFEFGPQSPGAKPPPRRGAPFMGGGRFGGGRRGGRGRGGRFERRRPPQPGAGRNRDERRSPPPPDRFNRGRSREHLDRAIELLAALHREFPKRDSYQHMLAVALRDRSRSPGSDDFQRAVGLLEDLAKRFKNQPDYRFALVETWSRAGEPSLQRNNAERLQAEKLLKGAVKEAETLTLRHSSVPEYTLSYAHAAYRLALISQDLQRAKDNESRKDELLAEARRLYKVSDDLQTKLAQRFPSVVSHTFWLAKFRTARAQFLMRYGTATQARQLLTSLTAALKNVPEDHPGRRTVNLMMMMTYFDFAGTLARAGDDEGAQRAMRQGYQFRPTRDRRRSPGKRSPEKR